MMALENIDSVSVVEEWLADYAQTDCGMSPVKFLVEGPVGDNAGVEKVAAAMRDL